MLIPMPSPRGTNHERLFIRARSGPTAAFDSAEGLIQSTSEKLLAFLKDRLIPADLANVEIMLGGERPYAADARQFVKGRGSFSERFPDAARIKTAM